MKNGKIWKILYTVLFVLQLIAEAGTLTAILRLNMLPNKFLIPVIALFVLGLLVTGLLLFIPAKKRRGIGRRIIACLLAIAVIGLCVFAFSAIDKLQNTMDNITDTEDLENAAVTRQVYVMQWDPAQTLEDAAGYTFGLVADYDTANTEGAIATMEQQLGKTLLTKAYASIPEMLDALFAGECQAIIVNDGTLFILQDQEPYENLQQTIRLLHDAEVLEQSQPGQPGEQDEQNKQDGQGTETPSTPTKPSIVVRPDKSFNPSTTPFIMYVSGLDSHGTKLYRSRSDVNILMVVNPNTKQILLVNTPRDYFVPNPGGNGVYDKLTHCSAYGFENSLIAISELYDIELNYYSRINFTGFKKLVDAVGGVDVYSNVTYHRNGVQIVKGMNHLDGEGALVFARERKYLAAGDNDRGKNQMKIIKAIIEKATNGTTIITNYAEILESLGGMFVTSMSNRELRSLVKMQLDDMAKWDIQTYAVTGEGGWEYTYSSPGLKSWVMYQDEGRVEYGTQLINRVLNGEILTEEDVKYPG